MSTEKKLRALRRAYAESAGERFDRLIEHMTESPLCERIEERGMRA